MKKPYVWSVNLTHLSDKGLYHIGTAGILLSMFQFLSQLANSLILRFLRPAF